MASTKARWQPVDIALVEIDESAVPVEAHHVAGSSSAGAMGHQRFIDNSLTTEASANVPGIVGKTFLFCGFVNEKDVPY